MAFVKYAGLNIITPVPPNSYKALTMTSISWIKYRWMVANYVIQTSFSVRYLHDDKGSEIVNGCIYNELDTIRRVPRITNGPFWCIGVYYTYSWLFVLTKVPMNITIHKRTHNWRSVYLTCDSLGVIKDIWRGRGMNTFCYGAEIINRSYHLISSTAEVIDRLTGYKQGHVMIRPMFSSIQCQGRLHL